MSDWVRHTEKENQNSNIILAYRNLKTRESKYIALIDGKYSVQYWPDLAKKIETVSIFDSADTPEGAVRILSEHLPDYSEEDLLEELD